MERDSRENLKMGSIMGKALALLEMETNTKENSNMDYHMAKEL